MGVKVAFLGSEMPTEPTETVQGVLITGDALRSDATGDYVWLVWDDSVERRSVQIGGQRDRPQVLVVNGLAAGDTIVRSSEKPLTAGQSIKTN